MIWLEIIVVLGAIFFGIRLGGIGIGLCGGLGLALGCKLVRHPLTLFLLL